MSLPVYLSDFSHEATPDESAVFYYSYLLIEVYIITTCVALFVVFFAPDTATYWEKSAAFVGLLLFMPSILPCIYCSILSIIILIKKKIKKPEIIISIILLMIINYFLFNYLGMLIGLLAPMYLMICEDNSVDKYDKILKLQLAEQDRQIEMQLEKERIIRQLNEPIPNGD